MSLSNESNMVMPVTPAYGMGYGNGGMWGGEWGSWILLFLLFGMFGRGWGGWGNESSCCAPASCADLQRGFDNQSVMNKLNGLENGIASLGYDQLAQMNGINTNILNTGFGIQNAIQQGTVAGMQNTNAIQTQLANCCCGIEKGQMQITNGVDSGFCQTNYNLATNTNSIIQNARADTDRVIAKLDAMEMARKDETIAALRSQLDYANLNQSQANQNSVFDARIDAAVAEILRRTGHDCPTAAYVVQPPQPVTFPNWCNTCNTCG